jgi:hypothetical protein
MKVCTWALLRRRQLGTNYVPCLDSALHNAWETSSGPLKRADANGRRRGRPAVGAALRRHGQMGVARAPAATTSPAWERAVAHSHTTLSALAMPSVRDPVLSVLADRPARWDWTWRLELGPPGRVKHGSGRTRAAPQAINEQQWREWLGQAGLRESR